MKCLLHIVLAALLPALVWAQGLETDAAGLEDLQRSPQKGSVEWIADAVPDAFEAGAAGTLVFQAQITPGWKLYTPDSPAGRPVGVRFAGLPTGLTAGATRNDAEVFEGYDLAFEDSVRYFEDSGRVVVPLRAAASAPAGDVRLAGEVEYMICSETICIPGYYDFDVPLQILPAAAVAEPSTDPAPDTLPLVPEDTAGAAQPVTGLDTAGSDSAAASLAGNEPITESRIQAGESPYVPRSSPFSSGLFGFLLLAAGAGLAALLTPCVFPMIPLTVSFFTRQESGRAVKMALVYGLSIVATFTGLGLLMALLVGASGAQTIAANPWVNLFIGLVFVVFALSLIGAFELRVPNRLLNYVNQQGNERSGWIGVVFMGLTLTLVSFSCTVPFVGALLAATAGGEWSWPILGMVAFSTVFALPFVVFAAFPSGLKKLPKSGSWMGALTVTLGFIEMAAAFKFLSNADLVWGWGLISRPLVIAVWSVLFFVAGLYLIGKVRLSHEPPIESIGAGRLLSGIAAMALAIYLLPGLLGAPLGTLDAWLPPRQASDVSLLAGLSTEPGERPDGLAWHGNDEGPADAAIEAAFAESAQTGRPVFVDFTGYTCTNCRQMEATVFPKPAIAGRLSQDFVLLQLYTDAPEEGRALQRYQLELTGTVALPTYAIVSADRQLVAKWEGMASVEDFATFLEAGAARYAQATARAGG